MMKTPLLVTSLLLSLAACGQVDEGLLTADEGRADTLSGLAFEDAYLQCFDGEVEIGFYAGGKFIEESMYGMGDLEFDPANVIKIRIPGDRVYELSANTVFTTDGAGNDTFQVLYLDRNDIVPVVHLLYDHEEGFLRGHYSLPNFKTINRSGQASFEIIEGFGPENDVGEPMNCYDYTYGDL